MNLIFKFAAISLLATVNATAQVGYGPELGFGLSTMHFAPVIGFTSANVTPLPAARVGGTIDLGINKHIYFQSGLYFATKGQKRQFSFYTNDTSYDATTQTVHLYYIDLPANIVFKTSEQGKGRFYLGLGATFSYLAWGQNNEQSMGKYNDTAFYNTSNIKFTPGKSTWPALDLGINVTAGYELPNGLYFRAFYTAGLEDLGQNSEIDKNRIMGIAAGYYFGKHRNINHEKDELIDNSKD